MIFSIFLHVLFLQRNILMEKQFVRAKPLIPPKDRGGTSKQYQPKKNAKKYEEKQKTDQKDPREGIKLMIEAYEAYKPIPKTRVAQDLIANYSKLFSQEQKRLSKNTNANLNDCLRVGPKKEIFIKQTKPLSSDSSEPDWDSDCDKEIKLESKKIDDEIVKKVEEKLKKLPTKKADELQKYEKQFLEDYYRNKKAEAETNENSAPNQQENRPEKNIHDEAAEKTLPTVWNQYNPQVDALISGGFLEKINNDENDDDDFEIDDDFAWNDEADQQEPKKQSSDESSEQMDGDDIFADDKPRTVTERKDSNTEKSKQQKKGMVFINDHIFTTIAQKIGIHSEACVWVVSNKTDRFKVNTQYMNAYYRQELYKAFPYVSLNHSQFVKSDEIETEKGLEKFKKFNERKRHHRNMSNTMNRQYQNNRGRKQPHLYKPKN